MGGFLGFRDVIRTSMRLSKIKLAGFKSFVDPTTIEMPSNLIGIVGPNGCGKSNTIDAVRWVMGESSAKHLRGGSMEDVIFSGSSARKPVAQASVELVFDNTSGSLGGEYAQYAEISVRRQVTREGQSHYFLNSSRCRRRDITDIFLGTGLGPRSYAIIEQGMISRLIEAKPEEIRVYLEEAAGISKYKDRRRETENRIRHTRENLDRLNDLSEEIEKQVDRLKRQSETAEKYKVLKGQERQLRAQLLVLGWRDFQVKAQSQKESVRDWELKLEEASVALRKHEADIESRREQHLELNDHFNKVQGQYYKLGADISRLEQTIQHARDTKRRQEQELVQATQAWQEANTHIEQDQVKLAEVKQQLAEDEPEYLRLSDLQSESGVSLELSEEKMIAWQQRWDHYNKQNHQLTQQAQIERTRAEQLERYVTQHKQRQGRIEAELGQVDIPALELALEQALEEEQLASEQLAEKQTAFDELDRRIKQLRGEMESGEQALAARQKVFQGLNNQLMALEAVNKAALNTSSSSFSDWLNRQGLSSKPRLAQELEVEAGWEKAVQVVLHRSLEAICIDHLDEFRGGLDDRPEGDLVLLEAGASGQGQAGSLLAKVHTQSADLSWLESVYTAETLQEALQRREGLSMTESIVTRDGFWVGRHWLRVGGQAEGDIGILEREREIKRLQIKHAEAQAQLESGESDHQIQAEMVRTAATQREQLQKELNNSHREQVHKSAQVRDKRSRLEQATERQRRVAQEMAELREQIEQGVLDIEESRAAHAQAMEALESLAADGDQLSQERDRLQSQLSDTRIEEKQHREQAQQIAVRLEALRTSQASLEQNIARMQSQLVHTSTRREELEALLLAADEPMDEHTQSLEALLESRLHVEQELSAARDAVEMLEKQLRQLEQDRLRAESTVNEVREQLNQAKFAVQESQVRGATLLEQITASGYDKDRLLAELAPNVSSTDYEARLNEAVARIERLGPINLAAIDEYQEQLKRQELIEQQHKDITDALETLERAIAKIDRETKSKFKETFDQVNTGLQGLFPRLFGGGQASLELTGDNLLDTGVSIMARPPGKRVSHIQLLSGGEKALTAVALVFAFFELNPAPFCMLDEVDAPLDDANVGRFCDLVREMSDRVQFIFITHNKATMELSSQLMGVTMNEPGVSRLVSVDVQEAARMATA